MDIILYVIGAVILAAAGYTGFKYLNKSKSVSARNNSIAAGRDVSIKSRANDKK
ncbi:hypothetical protein ACFSOZ_11630 [Mesorhizobium newzealandense]|uniref:Pilus assembly protein n=1 Tax=Mesorhizobium newzealandense TaxID=1300302 RepID=A0ABW4UB57_9HYPH|nr:hypothetical protein [Mesorhizobium sophorae]